MNVSIGWFAQYVSITGLHRLESFGRDQTFDGPRGLPSKGD
jgi:hypothetical protein